MAEADTSTTVGDKPSDNGGAQHAENRSSGSNMSTIFVDGSQPATLRYSETSVTYPKLLEARDAWLALPPATKIDASITTDGNGGACYRGWDIYRLWVR
jgi:hypothetical protein